MTARLPARLPSALALAIALLGPGALAQQPDLAAAEQELARMFDRPAGTPISEAQKETLGAFLQRFAGKDLGRLGYAQALYDYLMRDYDAAVAALDAHLAHHPKIDNEEHRGMAGRIYLNAVSREARAEQPDMGKLVRWAERMTRLYGDVAMLTRMATTLAPRVPDPVGFRVALASGVFQSDLTNEQKDAFLVALYAMVRPQEGDPGREGARPATAPAGAGQADQAGVIKPGEAVPAFAAELVLNGPEKFDLTAYRGKVVVLDFFATWCPPCRAGTAEMVALQKAHPDDVVVLGVTRFYGRGMDFSAADATLPHGGKAVDKLDRDAEIAVNKAFVAAFGLNYPLLFTDADLARKTFGVSGIPTMFVVGRDGVLRGKVVGNGEEQQRRLHELVTGARQQR